MARTDYQVVVPSESPPPQTKDSRSELKHCLWTWCCLPLGLLESIIVYIIGLEDSVGAIITATSSWLLVVEMSGSIPKCVFFLYLLAASFKTLAVIKGKVADGKSIKLNIVFAIVGAYSMVLNIYELCTSKPGEFILIVDTILTVPALLANISAALGKEKLEGAISAAVECVKDCAFLIFAIYMAQTLGASVVIYVVVLLVIALVQLGQSYAYLLGQLGGPDDVLCSYCFALLKGVRVAAIVITLNHLANNALTGYVHCVKIDTTEANLNGLSETIPCGQTSEIRVYSQNSSIFIEADKALHKLEQGRYALRKSVSEPVARGFQLNLTQQVYHHSRTIKLNGFLYALREATERSLALEEQYDKVEDARQEALGYSTRWGIDMKVTSEHLRQTHSANVKSSEEKIRSLKASSERSSACQVISPKVSMNFVPVPGGGMEIRGDTLDPKHKWAPRSRTVDFICSPTWKDWFQLLQNKYLKKSFMHEDPTGRWVSLKHDLDFTWCNSRDDWKDGSWENNAKNFCQEKGKLCNLFIPAGTKGHVFHGKCGLPWPLEKNGHMLRLVKEAPILNSAPNVRTMFDVDLRDAIDKHTNLSHCPMYWRNDPSITNNPNLRFPFWKYYPARWHEYLSIPLYDDDVDLLPICRDRVLNHTKVEEGEKFIVKVQPVERVLRKLPEGEMEAYTILTAVGLIIPTLKYCYGIVRAGGLGL